MTQKAFKFRFYPTPEQETLLRKTLGCTRLIYNRALAARTEAWYERQERIGYKETSAMLTEWKKLDELDFLNEVSCVPLQQGLRHLQKAYTNFFAGRAKYPNFKKKSNGASAEFTKSAFKYRDGNVYLAKCADPLPIRWSRQLPKEAVPSTITVRLTPSGCWYVSLLVDISIAPLPPATGKLGIDLGISSLLTLSDGTKITNPKTFRDKRRKLRKAHKALARKQKGSNNRYKARLKVARIHAEIADARQDHLHKLTTQLICENQMIVVEDLAVKNMIKNHKLALSISDASWGEIVRQLEYKAEWYGRELVKIDRWFPSSKRCSNCGHIVDKMPLNIRDWVCPDCGCNHDRDVNAAKNILAAGLAVSVCGATVRPEESKSRKAGAMKQKP
ncbi:RNA-guided endonuclease InsQ/TnpB family protein [Roseofilum capinflatum]|uniref:RNA-guided endonuclease TnpB family protein n=1 Tax=Roseofilum capinflatum BLCC-M114 TaxID=3022440 RepID=A0ABT7BC33_9CYAN|nr:RNA-guided endonuclease TnpB family protein [Roseofilum capinflatum]MDJ1175699.1 RNA-guided endonuclease TnpB family protein [Roseofilum capinflatum BLCC-M114]MDJ1176757.1 RNA-guided endonuclease TnpB family protein [Roseofilum capinflatum BLCC-M114]